jgi:predicted O-methyltransferase YrrM
MREDARLTTIEIDARTSREALENIRRAALSDRITILTGDALALIPQIPAPLDFVFVDAEKVEYGNYLRLFEEKLHAGSIVVADNAGAYPTAMRDYLDRVRNSGHYESRFIPVGWDGLEVSRRL